MYLGQRYFLEIKYIYVLKISARQLSFISGPHLLSLPLLEPIDVIVLYNMLYFPSVKLKHILGK